MSPEGSARGRDCDNFFSHLLTQVYPFEVDAIYICGDFNNRIANKEDYIGDIDSVPPRTALDFSSNGHGELLLDFLRDSTCCVLNGRMNNNSDNFTSISVRGKAVGDYIITPHDCLESCVQFRVITPTDLMDSNNAACIDLIGERCHLPDHSVLMLNFKVGVQIGEESLSVGATKRRHRTLPDNFLSSEMCGSALLQLVRQLEALEITQNNVDSWYNQLCDYIISEMDTCQPKKCLSDNQNKAYQKYLCSKPYWNKHLKMLWKERKMTERKFLRCKDITSRQQLKDAYRHAQSMLDRNLRHYKRNFLRGQSLRLEFLQTSNPQKFWREINKLGPLRLQKIPMEVLLSDDTVEKRKEFVLRK